MATQEEVDDFLAHHGIKGMHWGVRNAESKDEKGSNSSGSETSKTPSNHAKLKKAAVIGGSVAGVALIAAGTYYLVKHGDLSVSSFGAAEKAVGKKTVEETLKPSEHELTGIVHIAGVKQHPDATFRTGGVPDVFSEMKKSGLVNDYAEETGLNHYRRYGKNLEKVAVRFPDPHGRKDRAGRPINHAIILPKQHSDGITNYAEAKAKAWSLTKDDYEKFWQYGLNPDYSGTEARRLGIKD